MSSTLTDIQDWERNVLLEGDRHNAAFCHDSYLDGLRQPPIYI
jgi:hypothetical protein